MRSIPRSGQTRTALICKRALYKFPSCGVYKDKAIALTQSAIETGENVSILNPDKLKLKDIIIKNILDKYETLDFVASNEDMEFLEEVLTTKTDKELTVAKWIVNNKEDALKYDYIIFDISPSSNILGRNILNACTSIIFISMVIRTV